MSRRRNSERDINKELEELERQISTLTVRANTLRAIVHPATPPVPPPPRQFVLGDKVEVKVEGRQEPVIGYITRITAKRIIVRNYEDEINYTRAPHNITLIDPYRQPTSFTHYRVPKNPDEPREQGNYSTFARVPDNPDEPIRYYREYYRGFDR